MSWLIPPKPHLLLLFSPFSLLFSFIYITHSNPPLLHFQSPSPSVTTPRSFVTLSPHPLLLPSVPLLLCLLIPCYYPLFLCYSVFSSPVTIPCSFVTLSPLILLLSPVPLLLCLLLPCLSSPHPLLLPLCSFVTLSPLTLSPYTLSCKECLPVLSTGAFTLSTTRPFKHAEHAFLAPWRRPSCM